MPSNRARHCWASLAFAAGLLAATEATAAVSHIGRPLHRGPAYVFASGAFSGLSGTTGTGYALGVLLRPLRAAELIDSCYAGNTGVILQVDVQGGSEGRKLVSGDLVLRRYLRDMRSEPGGHSPYLGLGFGLSALTAPVGGGDGFSLLLEAGLEREVMWSLVVSGGAQYRLYRIAGQDDPAWSLEAGVALPMSF
jgi:hypothetical protein